MTTSIRSLIVCSVAVAAAVAGTALLSGATAVSTTRQDPATASAPREIEILAYRYAFEPSQVEVTEGDRVRLLVRSADGVHGLAIRQFGVKQKIPRKGGDAVAIDFVASRPGTFEILCSEDCGEGHSRMKGTLVVRARGR